MVFICATSRASFASVRSRISGSRSVCTRLAVSVFVFQIGARIRSMSSDERPLTGTDVGCFRHQVLVKRA